MPPRKKNLVEEWVESVGEAVADVILAQSLIWGCYTTEDPDNLLLLRRIQERLGHDPDVDTRTEPSSSSIRDALQSMSTSLCQLQVIYENISNRDSGAEIDTKELDDRMQVLGRTFADLVYDWLVQRREIAKAEKKGRSVADKFITRTQTQHLRFQVALEDWGTAHKQSKDASDVCPLLSLSPSSSPDTTLQLVTPRSDKTLNSKVQLDNAAPHSQPETEAFSPTFTDSDSPTYDETALFDAAPTQADAEVWNPGLGILRFNARRQKKEQSKS